MLQSCTITNILTDFRNASLVYTLWQDHGNRIFHSNDTLEHITSVLYHFVGIHKKSNFLGLWWKQSNDGSVLTKQLLLKSVAGMAPLLAITACRRRGIDLNNRRTVAIGMFCHPGCSANQRSRTFCGCCGRRRSLRPSSSHMCLMQFMSGDAAGHSRTSIPWFIR